MAKAPPVKKNPAGARLLTLAWAAKLLYIFTFILEKLTYIHNNPLEYGLCDVS